MRVNINPNTLTSISTSSCTISCETSNFDLVSIYEGDIHIVDSYLNTPITILTDKGLEAKSHSKDVTITVELL